MATDNKDKKWGTIYLDASRESSLEQLDAMQAVALQEQRNQRTQQEYMDKVRAKATERARQILGEAYTERQKVLDEARAEAESVRLSAQALHHEAEGIRTEAGQIHETAAQALRDAENIREAAQGQGFDDGLAQAQEELESFRAAMGSSVAGVLMAIHGQCGAIFEGWRAELVELLKVCVEKGTNLVLDEQYPLVLEHLVMEAVRQLDDRRCITLRVHPDDAAAVADMFAAAKERLPNLGQWIVNEDAGIHLGGLIAESQSGTVDSRLELHRDLVQNILQHLVLPGSTLDAAAAQSVEEAVRLEAQKIAELAPPAPGPELEPELKPEAQQEGMEEQELTAEPEPLPELEYEDHRPPVPQAMPEPPAALFSEPDTELLSEPEPAMGIELEQEVETASAPEPTEPDELVDAAPPPLVADPLPSANHEPTRDQLEEELFDMPEPTPLDGVLAQGGFLDDEEPRS